MPGTPESSRGEVGARPHFWTDYRWLISLAIVLLVVSVLIAQLLLILGFGRVLNKVDRQGDQSVCIADVQNSFFVATANLIGASVTGDQGMVVQAALAVDNARFALEHINERCHA